ncbi:MAG: heavy-metal-associated domain-containing protein [Verrucomicrobiaceae bacterium]|nr:heavy-metal-associated domain-containing protein [Verrucomicrobiaceae bacterium]
MKLPACILSLLISTLAAADKPTPVTRTFYVSGVECGSCVYMVQQSIGEAKGVEDVTVVQIIDNYANVTYDPAVLSEHQVAQAVREAIPLHGTPYLATLRIHVPDYSKHASKITELFARWKSQVTAVPSLEVKNQLIIHFEPLKADAKKTSPQGWTFAAFSEAMKQLGITFTVEQEG